MNDSVSDSGLTNDRKTTRNKRYEGATKRLVSQHYQDDGSDERNRIMQ